MYVYIRAISYDIIHQAIKPISPPPSDDNLYISTRVETGKTRNGVETLCSKGGLHFRSTEALRHQYVFLFRLTSLSSISKTFLWKNLAGLDSLVLCRGFLRARCSWWQLRVRHFGFIFFTAIFVLKFSLSIFPFCKVFLVL